MPLAPKFDISQFDCGSSVMNDWLLKKAFASEGRTARTFVVCDNNRVVGYYCLAMGQVLERNQPKKMRKHGDPKEIPVAIIGRLAVDQTWHGRGLGGDLLGDALKRAVAISNNIGLKAVMVHAFNDRAAQFWEKRGFQRGPGSEQTYFLPIETILAGL
jgi:GNAT superfamily N-acetyltransferase